MRLAVLDLGSFSFHLALFRATEVHAIERIAGASEAVRLAAGILADGRIDDAAWWRATAALSRLSRMAAQSEPHRLVAVATSAIRDAANGAAFRAHLAYQFDLAVEILTCREEAQLGYWGARAGLPGAGTRLATIELGGGSLQVAAGDHQSCRVATSVPTGVLRIARLGDDAIRSHVALAAGPALELALACRPEQVLLSGGSARRLARLAVGLGFSHESASAVTRDSLARIRAELDHLRPSDLERLGVEQSRAGTLRPAAVVFDTLLSMTGAPAFVTPGGLREGIVLRELSRAPRSRHQRGRHLPTALPPGHRAWSPDGPTWRRVWS